MAWLLPKVGREAKGDKIQASWMHSKGRTYYRRMLERPKPHRNWPASWVSCIKTNPDGPAEATTGYAGIIMYLHTREQYWSPCGIPAVNI